MISITMPEQMFLKTREQLKLARLSFNHGERMATLYFTVGQSIDTGYGEACVFGGCELVAFAFLPLHVAVPILREDFLSQRFLRTCFPLV